MNETTLNSGAVSFADMKKRSQWADVWKRLTKNKMAMIGLVLVVLIILVAIFAKFLAPYDPYQQNPAIKLQMPSAEHLMGTDNFGRDLLSRIIYGARTSLLVALLSLVMSMVVGILLGATAGYFGGAYEAIVMRLMDIIMAIPGFLLAVSIASADRKSVV